MSASAGQGPPQDGSSTASALLIYDGECAFCDAARRWLFRRIGRQSLAAIPWQSPELHLHAPLANRERARHELLLQLPGGELCGGAEAVLRSLTLLRAPWRWIGYALLRLPGPGALEPAYRWVARHRGRLGSLLGTRIDESDPQRTPPSPPQQP